MVLRLSMGRNEEVTINQTVASVETSLTVHGAVDESDRAA